MNGKSLISDSMTPQAVQTIGMSESILVRMENAVAKVRERLLRATTALNKANIPYAVVGGNAIASWVATVDEGAVRTTRDVDLLVRRDDLPAIRATLEAVGFVAGELLGVTMFRDGPEGKPSEAIHLIFAGELIRPEHTIPAPTIDTVSDPANYRVITLESLVEMKLLSNRDKNRTHLRDLISVGLIDSSWVAKFPSELSQRLQTLLDSPEG